MALGALGGPGGKQPSRLGVEKGGDGQLETGAAVEVVQQDDMREAVQILQAFGVLGLDLHPADNPPARPAGCMGIPASS